MRIRNIAIASIAVMAMAMPARADLILQFLDVTGSIGGGAPIGTYPNQTNNFIPLGTQPYVYVDPNAVNPDVNVPAVPSINTVNMVAGERRIIQVALMDTVVGNTFPPLGVSPNPPSSIPPSGVYTAPRWLSSAAGTGTLPQQFGLTLWETRITGTVVGPIANPTGGAFIAPPNAVPGIDPDYGNNRIALTMPTAAFVNAGSLPPTFSDFGGLLATGNGAIPNRNYGTDANQAQLGGRFSLFNFEITVPDTSAGGTFPIVISDRSAFNDFEVRATGAGGVGTAGDRIALDSTIFSAAHSTFTLNVNVTPVPEPSSIALIGMTVAGLGFKLRRKMKAKAEATA
jgi:hypothetical protein